MRELNVNEIPAVGGAGTLAEPITDPQSEFGKAVNDVAGALNEFGQWLGGWLWEKVNG